MRTISYTTDSYGTATLADYRPDSPAPRPRRRHRCPLGLGVNDLISLSMVVMTLAAAGVVRAGL